MCGDRMYSSPISPMPHRKSAAGRVAVNNGQREDPNAHAASCRAPHTKALNVLGVRIRTCTSFMPRPAGRISLRRSIVESFSTVR